MDLKQFIAENNITMTSKPVSSNPNMDDGGTKMNHHLVTINFDGEDYTTHFSMGLGHIQCKNAKNEWKRADSRIQYKASYGFVFCPNIFSNTCIRLEDLTPADKKSIGCNFVGFAAQKSFRFSEPKIDEVLDCLAMDAATSENARSFEDFCSDLGYDTDNRNAEKIYRACMETANSLRKILGHEKFETLLFECERM